MKVTCEYCGNLIDDTLEKCPNCGAPNSAMTRTTSSTPKTIEELQAWYTARGLPPYEKTRFFIGQDYKGPKAFGIYRENGLVTVYKNKADGTRSVRYRGRDEAYAVNEIYLKLKSEIIGQKNAIAEKKAMGGYKAPTKSAPRSEKAEDISPFDSKGSIRRCIESFLFGAVAVTEGHWPVILAAVALPWLVYFISKRFKNEERGEKLRVFIKKKYFLYLALITLVIGMAISYTPGNTYYNVNGDVYCKYDGQYYLYNGGNYSPISHDLIPNAVLDGDDDYLFDSSDDAWLAAYSFTDSDYYHDNIYEEHSSSWGSGGSTTTDWFTDDDDDDYDWGDDDDDWDWDWDSGGTDWDSDW